MRGLQARWPVWGTREAKARAFLIGVAATLPSSGCGSMAERVPGLEGSVLASTVTGDTDPGLTTLDSLGKNLSFDVSRTFCCDPLNLEFSVTPTDLTLPPGTSVEWDFGDGRTGVGSVASHRYPSSGTYLVGLRAVWPGVVVTSIQRLLSLRSDPVAGILVDVYDYNSARGGDTGLGGGSDGSSGLIVDAGPEQTVGAGDTVTLVGRVTANANRGAIHLAWMQVSGPPVRLQPNNQPTVTFIAPDVEGETDTLAFELAVTQDDLRASDEVRVTVRSSSALNGTNTPPTVFDQRVSVTQEESIVLALSASDSDGDELTFRLIGLPENGTVGPISYRTAESAVVTYVPFTGFAGTDSLRFVANDASADSNVATIVIEVIPDDGQPRVLDRSYLVPIDATVRLTLDGRGAEEMDLTFAITGPPRHGTLGPVDNSRLHSAFVTYTPDTGYRGMDGFQFSASHEGVTSNESTITLEVMKRFAPWVEFNKPPLHSADILYGPEHGIQPGWTFLDYYLAGIEEWSEVTSSVVVITIRRRLEADSPFPALMRRKPSNLKIIPGIKTAHYIPGAVPVDLGAYDFADRSAWQLIATHARQIVSVTGTNIVALENETATHPYHALGAPIDYDRLRDSLGVLADTGIEFWWYLPEVDYDTPNFPNREEETTRFVETVIQALPQSKFRTLYTGFSGWEGHHLTEPWRRAMMDLVGLQNMNETLYTTVSGYIGERYYYKPAEALTQLRDVLPSDNVNIIWPGGSDWLNVAREFVDRLPPLADVLSAN